jgi:hypothetical protein
VREKSKVADRRAIPFIEAIIVPHRGLPDANAARCHYGMSISQGPQDFLNPR